MPPKQTETAMFKLYCEKQCIVHVFWYLCRNSDKGEAREEIYNIKNADHLVIPVQQQELGISVVEEIIHKSPVSSDTVMYCLYASLQGLCFGNTIS